MKPRVGQGQMTGDGDYYFRLYDEDGRLFVSFSYLTKEAAEAAAEHFRLGLAECQKVSPVPPGERDGNGSRNDIAR